VRSVSKEEMLSGLGWHTGPPTGEAFPYRFRIQLALLGIRRAKRPSYGPISVVVLLDRQQPYPNELIPKFEVPRRDRVGDTCTPSPCPPQASVLGLQRFAAVAERRAAAEKGGYRDLPAPSPFLVQVRVTPRCRSSPSCLIRGALFAFGAGRLATMGRGLCSEMLVDPGPEPR
jgi:hypothetical protein